MFLDIIINKDMGEFTEIFLYYVYQLQSYIEK